MPRPKLSNPSPRTLYMRQYRDSKLTEAQRIDKAVKEQANVMRRDPKKAPFFRRQYNERRREIYQARKVIEANHPLSFRGSEVMTVEDALYILRDKGVRDLIANDPKKKPSKNKGRPKIHLLDSPQKVNQKIRQMVLAQGLTPASPDLTPLEEQENPFNINRPINLTKELTEMAKQEAENLRIFQNSLRAQGLLDAPPKPEEGEEEVDPFGNQVFDFSPDK